MSKRVSVIMPCYNDGQYLEEAIGSVFAQDYENVELVIADDGSEDAFTQKYLHELAALGEGRGIRVLFLSHGGVAAARNRAIEAATGEYILPLDADDKIEPPYLREAAAVLDAEPRVGVVYCHADKFGVETGPWDLPEWEIGAFLNKNILFNAALFRKLDWARVGGYPEKIDPQYPEDWDFWLSLLETGLEVRCLAGCYFHYRIRETGRHADLFTQSGYLRMHEEIAARHLPFFRAHLVELLRAIRKENSDYILAVRQLFSQKMELVEKLEAARQQLARRAGPKGAR